MVPTRWPQDYKLLGDMKISGPSVLSSSSTYTVHGITAVGGLGFFYTYQSDCLASPMFLAIFGGSLFAVVSLQLTM